jgi:hypothetical protein
MTPKEKAKQLFDLMFEEIYNKGMYDDLFRAKQCSLIAVDELIKVATFFNLGEELLYWEEVKQQIQN